MEYHLEVKKTFRYFTFGDPNKATKIIYALHGYGQLAEYFLLKFKKLNPDFFIVAPEGMHRFYLSGSSGRVGASWMTKEAREQDIRDTINWLDSLEEEINNTYQFDKKITLGFSQGGATAARWNYLGKIKADNVLYWASVFPPDLEENRILDSELNSKNYFILGDQDEYFNESEQKKVIEFYSKQGFNTIKYIGNHSINEDVLIETLNSL